jgi:hypothetical protein
MITLALWFCSDDHVNYRTKKPTWSSLQELKANVVIITGLESQRGHHYKTRKPMWTSLQDQKANVLVLQ